MRKKLVGIVMGSDSDLKVMKRSSEILEMFNIGYEMIITSAHRSPARTIKFAKSAMDKGLEVLIVGAGSAAHLAGVISAHNTIPVIGVPIDSSSLKGLDALLSTVQMPAGIPVATMAIGEAGAKNAGILAAEILSIKYPEIRDRLKEYRKSLAKEVEQKSRRLQSIMKEFKKSLLE